MSKEQVQFEVFRKGLSTIVETALEACAKSPVYNYFNNAKQTIATIKNKELFYQQGVEALNVTGEIDKIKAEMQKWYTEESSIKYSAELVSIIIRGCTAATIGCVIEIGIMADELNNFFSNGGVALKAQAK